MFDTTTETYNIDNKIDYFAVRSMVIRSLKIAREELNRHIARINLHKTDTHENKEDIVIASTANNLFDHQDDDA